MVPFTVILAVFCWATPAFFATHSEEESTLKLIHALFRHGDRNPYPWTSSYFLNETFYPEGFGQLTNDGKRRAYKLGRILRKRYDFFLGKTWNIDFLDVRTTNYDRTKMTAELVLTGLYPPQKENVWNPYILWQPIPYSYQAQDLVIGPFACRSFLPELFRTIASPRVSSYLQERYGEMMTIMNESAGISMDGYFDAGIRYSEIKIQDDRGFPLEDWMRRVYPEPLHSLAVDIYYIATNTSLLRHYNAGYLLQKIVNDTSSLINGTLTPPSRKMFMYSAHEINIATFLLSLQAFKLVDVPTFASCVLVEVHEIQGVYGFKLFYIDYTTEEPHGPLVIPGCSEFCPFEQFYDLVEELFPPSHLGC